MRLPDWLYRQLCRVVASERRRRDQQARIAIARRDQKMRAWADRARAAHAAGRCVDGCPFAGCLS